MDTPQIIDINKDCCKRRYAFHYDIAKKHVVEFNSLGSTLVKSYFILQIVEELLVTTHRVIKVRSDTTYGFWWSGNRRDKKKYYPDKQRILKLIDNNQIDIEEVKEIITRDYLTCSKTLTSTDIDNLFNKSTPTTQRLQILNLMSNKYCKFGALSCLIVYKMYYKVTL